MPCRLSRNDNKTFLATAGPYCSAIDKELNKIITNYAQPPAHVAFCTCVDRTVVTAHTDYAILSWVDGIITNLLDCTESRPSMEYTFLLDTIMNSNNYWDITYNAESAGFVFKHKFVHLALDFAVSVLKA